MQLATNDRTAKELTQEAAVDCHLENCFRHFQWSSNARAHRDQHVDLGSADLISKFPNFSAATKKTEARFCPGLIRAWSPVRRINAKHSYSDKHAHGVDTVRILHAGPDIRAAKLATWGVGPHVIITFP